MLIQFSHLKKEVLSFETTWMELEEMKLNEITSAWKTGMCAARHVCKLKFDSWK